MLAKATHLFTMLRAERRPAAELAARSDARLRRLLLRAAQRVPVYRDLYRAAGFDAAAMRGVLLENLPVVDKALLRAAGADAWDGPATPQDAWIATSGSTGEPFRFPITADYDQRRKAQYLRPYLANGRGLRDEVVRLTFAPRGAPWFARLGLLRETQLRCDTDPRAVLAVLRERGASVLQGYPSALRAVACRLRSEGSRLPGLRAVFTDSELLAADTRRIIEDAFGVAVIDIFGSFETDNIAYQCRVGGGYHVTTDCVIVELLHQGRPAAPGQEGELVVTVLDNLRSPFIRYNLRDIARWSQQPCACGSSFPTLEILAGRADDLLQLPDGSRVSAMRALGAIDTFAGELISYQLRQAADGACELRYERTADAAVDLEGRIRVAIGSALPGLPLRLVPDAAIARTRAGKLRAFVREPAPQDA